MTDYRNKVGKSSDSWPTGMQTGASAGDVTVSNIDVNPRSVSPGGTVSISVTVEENIVVMGWSADTCNPSLVGSGVDTNVKVYIPGLNRSASSNKCVAVYSTKSGTSTFDFELQVPTGAVGDGEEAEFDVNVDVIMAGTGNHSDSATSSVTVSSSGQGGPGCASDSDCGQGKECIDGTCVEAEGPAGEELLDWVIKNPIKSGAGLLGGSLFVRIALGD